MPELKRRAMTIASTGALGLGALAALLGVCCGAPWLVAAIGVTGAIAVAGLAFSAPHLWVLAFLVALATLAWTYRAVPACDVDRTAPTRRGGRLAAWIVVMLLIILFIATRGWSVLAFAQ